MATYSISDPNGVLQMLLLLVFLVPFFLFLLTEQNTLKKISQENRLLRPGLVWLQLIPLFGLVWQFFVVIRIAGSIQNEFQRGNEDSIVGFADGLAVDVARRKPTQAIGLTYCILSLLLVGGNLILDVAGQDLFIWMGLAALGTMVCWLVYWVSLAGWKRQLRERAHFVI